ncbi:hypothetical protein [Microbacterium oxydans]|uniref:hypothetical protein n=1 Tax=Microbacterium oxydans TaxID=82380 RepID=UPI00226BB551|nr:hypothetical protein [Microbacterium oxydans]WAA67785.1 hypothetical protein MME74_08525 [Microbacterium oxydans]
MTDSAPKRPKPANQAGRDDPTYQQPAQATGDVLADRPGKPSVWHATPRLPSTLGGARQLYGDDMLGGPRG